MGKIKHIFVLCIIGFLFSNSIIAKAEENQLTPKEEIGQGIEISSDEDKHNIDISNNLIVNGRKVLLSSTNTRDWNSYSGGQYCYTQMNDREKKFYDDLKQNSEILMTTPVNSPEDSTYATYGKISYSGLTRDTAESIYMLFLYNNPQYWFYNGQWLIDSTNKYLIPTMYALQMCYMGSSRLGMNQELGRCLDYIEKELDYEIATCKCDLEKEHLIHDFICKRIIYDLDYEMNQSVYSAIRPYTEGNDDIAHTVCAGYSKFYTMLANHYGLPSVSVVFMGATEGHAWNRTCIDGIWYCIDCTWDDSTSGWSYRYFNKSITTFEETYGHESNVFDKYLPTCTQNMTFSPKKSGTTTKTCSQYASQLYTCKSCNNVYSKVTDMTLDDHVEADNWIITKETSCTEAGSKELHCKNCDTILKTEEIPIINHISDNGTITKEPTCITLGEKTYKCTVCNTVLRKESIAKTSCISDNGTRTEPTCKEDGYIEYRCQTCNKPLRRETLHKIDHQLDNGTITIEPTHGSTGEIVYRCKNCNEIIRTDVLPTTSEHRIGEPVITKEPTCTEDGEKTYYCIDCGEVIKTEPISRINHIMDNGTTIKATCTEEGNVTYRCTMCNVVLSSVTIPKLNHNSNNGVITKYPTCTEEGIKEYRCIGCNELLSTETIPMINHTLDNGTVIEQATCINDGKKEFKCTKCNNVINSEIIPHTNIHIYDNGEITVEPTCEEDGYKTYTCVTCGNTKTEKLNKINHTFIHHNEKYPTCLEEGNIEYNECTFCGKCYDKHNNSITKSSTILNISGHKLNLICENTPTCTTDGNIQYYECKVCNKLFRDDLGLSPCTLNDVTLKATNHANKRTIPAKASKIGVPGNIKYYICPDCGLYFDDEEATHIITANDVIIKALPQINIKTTCTVTGIKSVYAWTGSAIKPVITIKDTTKNKVLKLNTDYTVTYTKNINAGTATIAIKGKGDYTGTITKTFTIKKPILKYRAYTLSQKWNDWKTATIGTKTQSIYIGTTKSDLSGYQMKLSGIDGYINYRGYVQGEKWQDWTNTNKIGLSGTKKKDKRLEMVQFQLKGQVSTLYNIYYRTYINGYGWTGWATNNQKCGTSGIKKQIKCIQIQLVPKDSNFNIGTKDLIYK